MPDFFIPLSVLAENDFGKNRAFSIALSAIMLYPRDADIHKVAHYRARCLFNLVPFLAATNKCSCSQAAGIMGILVEEDFGGWEGFSEALLGGSIPASGPGSLQSLAKRGYIVGGIFQNVFYTGSSLKDAADLVLEGAESVGLLSEYGVSRANIVNNIWPAFKPVAHIWAAMREYVLPDEHVDYIQLDLAAPKQGAEDVILPGLQGIVELAMSYYEKAVEQGIRFRQSPRMLVDPETAWRIVLT